MHKLRTIWKELTSRYTDHAERAGDFWTELEKAYSAKNRHYHNLDHLEYMADMAFQFREYLSDLDTILFSIFYHDIVYKIKRRDNELKSADIAVDRLAKLGVPADQLTRCRNQILATRDHQHSSDSDTNYLLDFDLAILGDTPAQYDAYTKKIRAEYSIYPDILYKPGRKKVLQHFLDMDRIFKTDAFYKIGEQQARQNLNRELQGL